MQASIQDLRYHMKDVLAAIDRNETVTITYHGKVKAKLVPAKVDSHTQQQKKRDVTQHPFFGMTKNDNSDVYQLVREMRQGRYQNLLHDGGGNHT